MKTSLTVETKASILRKKLYLNDTTYNGIFHSYYKPYCSRVLMT